MNSSLDELAQYLPIDKFINVPNHFASRPQKDKALIRQKDTFSFRILAAMQDGLPPRDIWINTLYGGAVSVSEKEYQHA